jgi:hypothetical protein
MHLSISTAWFTFVDPTTIVAISIGLRVCIVTYALHAMRQAVLVLFAPLSGLAACGRKLKRGLRNQDEHIYPFSNVDRIRSVIVDIFHESRNEYVLCEVGAWCCITVTVVWLCSDHVNNQKRINK